MPGESQPSAPPHPPADAAERFRVDARHTLKNHLAVIIGYAELLLAETAPGDPRHSDLLEILRAAQSARRLVDAEDEA
jgi:signal transduction histidine kinase